MSHDDHPIARLVGRAYWVYHTQAEASALAWFLLFVLIGLLLGLGGE